MYCANCGNAINTGLNYCNRCGTKLANEDLEVRKAISENLSASLPYIGVFGFIGFLALVVFLVKSDVHPAALILLSLTYLATLFTICSMILKHLRALPAKSSQQNTDFQSNYQPPQLDAANTAQLEEPKQPPISVTEHTTRTLDKVKTRI